MKIRNGFVSNSSSSSFVILGDRISIDELDTSKLNKGEEFVAFGAYGEYGKDLLYLNEKMIELILENKDKFEEMEFIKAYYNGGDEYGEDIDLSKLPQKAKIWCGESGHPLCDDYDLKEYYINEDPEW